MFKLKAHKSFVKYFVPVRRTAIRNFPIAATKVRMYKFPLLKLTAPGVDELNGLHFSQLTIKLRFWTKRFFSLASPAVHSRFESAFRYQLKKYGIDVEYDFEYYMYDMALGYDGQSMKIETILPRPKVHGQPGWNQGYRFKLKKIDPVIAQQQALSVHGTHEAPAALTFPPLKASAPTELLTSKNTITASPFAAIDALKRDAFAAPFSILQNESVQKINDIQLQSKQAEASFSPLRVLRIHHFDYGAMEGADQENPNHSTSDESVKASTAEIEAPEKPPKQITPPSD